MRQAKDKLRGTTRGSNPPFFNYLIEERDLLPTLNETMGYPSRQLKESVHINPEKSSVKEHVDSAKE